MDHFQTKKMKLEKIPKGKEDSKLFWPVVTFIFIMFQSALR
jgi:hypothetical protein